jgi:uncharacterized protein (DUF1810 family)
VTTFGMRIGAAFHAGASCRGSAVQVFGQIDAAKLRSCLALFRSVDSKDAEFSSALHKFFAIVPDEKSLVPLNLSQCEA